MTGKFNALKEVAFKVSHMAVVSGTIFVPKRMGNLEGYPGKKNEVIYHPSKCHLPIGCLVFFGGDVQDYKENMLAHRDNKHHVKWDLESTATLLHKRFPDYAIVIVKPSKMSLKTFSCYENFVDVNNFGAPSYKLSIDGLKHLWLLLQNIQLESEQTCKQVKQISYEDASIKIDFSKCPVILIGFSKGCVVLNQLLYSFLALNSEPDEELTSFVKNIQSIYWLEGGHSGSSSTWVTDKSVLENFSNLKIKVHIHVTPYQVCCDTRPRIGKEEKIFRENLCRLGADISRSLHFEDEPRSLDMHFKVLEVFAKPVQ